MTPSTPEAEDDFDPTVAADPDVADLATDPLDAVLAAEGDEAGLDDELDDGLDEELEVAFGADDLDADLDDDEAAGGDDDVEDDDELAADDKLAADDDEAGDDLDPTAQDGDDDGVTPALALDPAFEDDDEDLAAVVAGDEDEDEDVDGIRDGEFVCRSCFLAKRDTQLADPERMLCRDCA